MRAKATSVEREGEPDGWEIQPGFLAERNPGEPTRLVVSVPTERLGSTHRALVRAMKAPLGFLYRQNVDRRNPRPQGAPPKDLVALDVPAERVLDALEQCAGLVYHDARHEIWIRGALDEQVILDPDGLIFCYPDDPAFRDVLAAQGLEEGELETLADRDYVKHWFHADLDVEEDRLVRLLGLVSIG